MKRIVAAAITAAALLAPLQAAPARVGADTPPSPGPASYPIAFPTVAGSCSQDATLTRAQAHTATVEVQMLKYPPPGGSIPLDRRPRVVRLLVTATIDQSNLWPIPVASWQGTVRGDKVWSLQRLIAPTVAREPRANVFSFLFSSDGWSIGGCTVVIR